MVQLPNTTICFVPLVEGSWFTSSPGLVICKMRNDDHAIERDILTFLEQLIPAVAKSISFLTIDSEFIAFFPQANAC